MLNEEEIKKLIRLLKRENITYENNIRFWENKKGRDSLETEEMNNQRINLKENLKTIEKLKGIIISIKVDQIWESKKVVVQVKILEENEQGYVCLSLTNGQQEVFTEEELLGGFVLVE